MMKYAIAAAAMVASSAVMADVGTVQVFYDRGVGDGDEEVSGFGVQGYAHVAPNVFFSGLYQIVDIPNQLTTLTTTNDIDLDELRIGVGVNSTSSEKAGMYGRIEYIKVDGDAGSEGSTDGDGFGLHAGVWLAATDRLVLGAEIGFADVEDDDNDVLSGGGSEYSFSASYALNEQFSVFAERREAAVSFLGNETRFGVGFSF